MVMRSSSSVIKEISSSINVARALAHALLRFTGDLSLELADVEVSVSVVEAEELPSSVSFLARQLLLCSVPFRPTLSTHLVSP